MTDKKSKHFHKRTPSSFHAPTWLGPSCIYSQVWKALTFTSWMLNNGEICLKRWDKLCTSIAVKGQGRAWVGEASLHWCKSERARSYVWCLNKYYRYQSSCLHGLRHYSWKAGLREVSTVFDRILYIVELEFQGIRDYLFLFSLNNRPSC